MLTFLITLVLIGVGLYCVNTLIPMDQKIKKVINIVVIIGVLFFVLQSFGVLSGVHLPQLK